MSPFVRMNTMGPERYRVVRVHCVCDVHRSSVLNWMEFVTDTSFDVPNQFFIIQNDKNYMFFNFIYISLHTRKRMESSVVGHSINQTHLQQYVYFLNIVVCRHRTGGEALHRIYPYISACVLGRMNISGGGDIDRHHPYCVSAKRGDSLMCVCVRVCFDKMPLLHTMFSVINSRRLGAPIRPFFFVQ